MGTLSRYILRQFAVNFLILLFVIASLFVLIDLITNMDEFMEAAKAKRDAYGGLELAFLHTIATYHGPVVLLLLVYLTGLLVFGAMGFVFMQMTQSGELTAIVASGVSLHRIAVPVLVAGAAVNALVWVDQEMVIPALAPKLARSHTELAEGSARHFAVHYAPDSEGNLFSARAFDARHEELQDAVILERGEDGRVRRRIVVPQARWAPERGGWRLFNAIARQGPREEGRTGAPSFFATDLSPELLLLRRATHYPRLMPLHRLRALARNPAMPATQRKRLQRLAWGRFSMVLMNILLMPMVMPLVLRIQPQAPVAQGVKGAVVAIGGWGGGLLLLEAGGALLTPLAGAFLPVLLFLPLAGFGLQSLRT
jgi:lipopolysaccharide export system permease protein